MTSRVYLKDHLKEGIGAEVHVDGWGPGPFFTVLAVVNQRVFLSKRYSDKLRYTVDLDKCYFTKRAGKRILRSKGLHHTRKAQ